MQKHRSDHGNGSDTWFNNSSFSAPLNSTPIAYPAMTSVSGYTAGSTAGNMASETKGFTQGAAGTRIDSELLRLLLAARTTSISWMLHSIQKAQSGTGSSPMTAHRPVSVLTSCIPGRSPYRETRQFMPLKMYRRRRAPASIVCEY